MGDPVQDNLSRGRLHPLNCVLLRVAVQENVQFGHLGDPPAIDFAIKVNGKRHGQSLTLTADHRVRTSGAGVPHTALGEVGGLRTGGRPRQGIRLPTRASDIPGLTDESDQEDHSVNALAGPEMRTFPVSLPPP